MICNDPTFTENGPVLSTTVQHSATPAADAAHHLHRSHNNFNLLRFCFAVLVIFSHVIELKDGNRNREILTALFHTISFGELAVAGFFLLSGYLIVKSWSHEPSFWQYIRKRVLRIYPAFIAASLICGLAIGPLAGDPSYLANFSITGFVSYMLALTMPNIPPVFNGSHYALVNAAMWTIRFEFVCYLAVPAAALLGLFRHRSRWLAATVAILALNIATNVFGLHWHPHGAYDVFSNPLVRLLMLFFVGGSFYLYRDVIRFRRVPALVAGVVLVGALFSSALAEIGAATAGAYLVFYFAVTPMPAFAWFNRLPDVSYGTYLYGWPAIKVLYWIFPAISVGIALPVTIVVSIACGVISWYLVEKPFLKLKPVNRGARAPLVSNASDMAPH